MAITTTADLSLDQAAWDLFLYFSLRPELHFDGCADVKSTSQAPGQGVSVTFTTFSDLAVASTPLTEDVDVTPETMDDSQVTLTLEEFGNAVKTTKKARTTSFVPLNPAVANVVGFNAGISIDDIAKTELEGGSNVIFANAAASQAAIDATDLLNAHDVRVARARLVGANVQKIGGLYNAYADPDALVDLREETGDAAWRVPHAYSQPEDIWNGETGAFEGFRWIETPRAEVTADAGAGAVDVYFTLLMGRQALAKGFSKAEGNGPMPHIVPGPVTDTLRRFVPMGWYWFGGYKRFREAALLRIESASTLGTNV